MNKGRDEKFRFTMHYPWRTLCAAVLLGSYALLLSSPALQQRLALPAGLWQLEYLQGMFVVLLLIAWFELGVFRRQQQKLRTSVEQLWLTKRELQLKAQTSASHTDKLKLFISDKLLEYIEYDEKFLHFKSIASEVRHNGVISFDKVQSALLYARDHSLPDEQGTQATLYQEALVGMRYLWDLLDLSTTDNMALHIGDHIAACEEQVFAAELQGINAEELPQAPLFDPRQALVDSLTCTSGWSCCSVAIMMTPVALIALIHKCCGRPGLTLTPARRYFCRIITATSGLIFFLVKCCWAMPITLFYYWRICYVMRSFLPVNVSIKVRSPESVSA